VSPARLARAPRAAEALCWLGLARLAAAAVPFRRSARLLGLRQSESVERLLEGQAAHAERVGAAVASATARAPWESSCMVQALAANAMLRVRRIPATLFLGVAKDADADLAAHAWVRCGDAIITGARERDRFTPVGAFSASRDGAGRDQ
jgi:hypothetical protein